MTEEISTKIVAKMLEEEQSPEEKISDVPHGQLIDYIKWRAGGRGYKEAAKRSDLEESIAYELEKIQSTADRIDDERKRIASDPISAIVDLYPEAVSQLRAKVSEGQMSAIQEVIKVAFSASKGKKNTESINPATLQREIPLDQLYSEDRENDDSDEIMTIEEEIQDSKNKTEEAQAKFNIDDPENEVSVEEAMERGKIAREASDGKKLIRAKINEQTSLERDREDILARFRKSEA